MDLGHEKRLTEVEQIANSNTRRINDLEKRQDDLGELVGTVKALAVREENVENDVKEIKSDVKTLTAKPGKMMDSIFEKIILLIVAAIVGYFLGQLGL